ncbi:hypothetical protein Lal_00019587 [Lupinus albus]|nr:hypothetical protein Lal_00019587 [Lupinus albus]
MYAMTIKFSEIISTVRDYNNKNGDFGSHHSSRDHIAGTPQILRIHYVTLEDDGNNCDNNTFKQANRLDQTFKQTNMSNSGFYVLYRLSMFKAKPDLTCFYPGIT